jgi:hypothetical protein
VITTSWKNHKIENSRYVDTMSKLQSLGPVYYFLVIVVLQAVCVLLNSYLNGHTDEVRRVAQIFWNFIGFGIFMILIGRTRRNRDCFGGLCRFHIRWCLWIRNFWVRVLIRERWRSELNRVETRGWVWSLNIGI